MNIQEQLVEKLHHLSLADQRRLLDFATLLERAAPPPHYRNPRGILAGLGPDVTEADIAEARREAWDSFPRDIAG
jgi:hypothetical protein